MARTPFCRDEWMNLPRHDLRGNSRAGHALRRAAPLIP